MFSNISRVILIAALVAFVGLVFSSTASALPTCDNKPTKNETDVVHCANTKASKGGGSDPLITNSFELPDMVTSGGKTGTPPVEPMQYILGSPTGVHTHDDGAHGKTSRQMMMKPNLDDKPNERQIEIWALAFSDVGPADVTDVHAVVKYPDGTTKVASFKLGQRTCAALGDPAGAPATFATQPLHAAIHTGQIALDKSLTGDTTINQAAHDKYKSCLVGQTTVWSGIFKLGKNQPYGKYSVELTATSSSAGLGPVHTESFLVLNVMGFKMDFTTVDWGTIAPGEKDFVTGNSFFGCNSQPGCVAPAQTEGFPSTKPTLENTGNSDMCLTVAFSRMTGKLLNNPHVIIRFDATFLGDNLFFDAGAPQQFPKKLGPNIPTNISFSIQPPDPLNHDDYQGRVDFTIKKAVAGATPCVP